MADNLFESRFRLADGVIRTAAHELDQQERLLFELQRGDVIFRLEHSRTPPIVAAPLTDKLLMLLEEPSRIDEVLAAISLTLDIDPDALATEALPAFKRLLKSGFIVQAEDGEVVEIYQPRFEVGDSWRGYRISRVVRRLGDTEVYAATDQNGKPVCLKLFKVNEPPVAEQFKRESVVLSDAALQGLIPRLLETFSESGGELMVMEWLRGQDLRRYAQQLRGRGEEGYRRLLRLLGDAFGAYDQLHRAGYLHGDVQPENILVLEEGDVRLIDFGFSCGPGLEHPRHRAGVVNYFEPEVAAARIAERRKPKSSREGEQYALCVIAFEALTGRQPYELTSDRARAYRQIARSAPFPVTRFAGWVPAEIGQVVSIGLAKHPDERNRSLAGIAEVFSRCAGQFTSLSVRPAVSDQLERFTDDFDPIALGLSVGTSPLSLLEAPAASINFGASGLAYTFYRLAIARHDQRLLWLADVWSTAARSAGGPNHTYRSRRLGVSPERLGRHSLLHAPIGSEIVGALIAIARGDVATSQRIIDRLVDLPDELGGGQEFAFGANGVLTALAGLVDAAEPHRLIDLTRLRHRAEQLYEVCLKALASQLANSEKPSGFIGAAHGLSGQMHSLLNWCLVNDQKPPEAVAEAATLVCAHSLSDGSGRYWSRKFPGHDDPDARAAVMSGWCNGSSGHVLALLLAHRFWPDAEFLDVALQAGEHIVGDKDANPALCCGMAGAGFALLALYRATGASRWLQEAQLLGASIPDYECRHSLAHSLFKGAAGGLVLKADLESSRGLNTFPLFEIEGWSTGAP